MWQYSLPKDLVGRTLFYLVPPSLEHSMPGNEFPRAILFEAENWENVDSWKTAITASIVNLDGGVTTEPHAKRDTVGDCDPSCKGFRV